MTKVVFILGVICVVLAFLYFRSCTAKPNTVDEKRDHAVDSMRQKAIADSSKWNVEKDSLSKINVVLFHQKDSLQKIAEASKQSLKGKDVDISNLVDRINQAEANHNDSEALAACDSLKAQYPIAKGLVTQYIKANDTLKKVTDSIINFKEGIIVKLNGLYSESNGMLFETSRLYSNQEEELKKARKDASKRWGIGPGFGVTYINGKVKPIVDINLQYNLFKF